MSTIEVLRQVARPHRAADSLPAPTRDVAQGLRDLADYGVALHEDFISAEMAERLQERMDQQAYMERKLGVGRVGGPQGLSAVPTYEIDGAIRAAQAGDTAEPIYQVIDSLVNKGRVFIELMMNKTAHAYADGVFGPHPWNLWGMNGIINRGGALEQFLHIDSGTLPPEMLTRAVMINCFVCVSDFDLGDRPHYDGDEAAARLPAVAKRGTAIIWDGRTWHGQGEHRSGKTRYAIPMSFCLYAIRPGENYPASVQDAVLETLSEEERLVLGWRTTMVGAMGLFGPRNPDDKHHGIGSSPHFIPELHRD
jgi:hypothetical protein